LSREDHKRIGGRGGSAGGERLQSGDGEGEEEMDKGKSKKEKGWGRVEKEIGGERSSRK